MNACMFTGWVSQFRQGRYAEWCANVILFDGEPDQLRAGVEKLLHSHDAEEGCTPVKVEKIVSAPVLDRLLTETGGEAIDWRQVSERAQAALEGTSPDDLGTGLWADCNALVPAGDLSPDLSRLQRDLPAEESSGLNWSADRQAIFIVNILSPPAPMPDLIDVELDPAQLRAREEEIELLERQAAFPEMAPRELVAVVAARNAVVAAWLWRRHAAGTALAGHAIRVDTWCGAQPLETVENPSAPARP